MCICIVHVCILNCLTCTSILVYIAMTSCCLLVWVYKRDHVQLALLCILHPLSIAAFVLKIWKHGHPVLATSMLGRVDMLCYLIHASVASWYLTCCNSSWFRNSYLTWSKIDKIAWIVLEMEWKDPGGIACRTDRAFGTAHFALVRTRARLCMTEMNVLSFWLSSGIGLALLLSKAWQAFNPWH